MDVKLKKSSRVFFIELHDKLGTGGKSCELVGIDFPNLSELMTDTDLLHDLEKDNSYLVDIYGFYDKEFYANVNSLEKKVCVIVCGNNDHGYIRMGGFDSLDHLQTIHTGHGDIRYDEVNFFPIGLVKVKPIHSIGEVQNLFEEISKDFLHDGSRNGVIFYIKNSRSLCLLF